MHKLINPFAQLTLSPCVCVIGRATRLTHLASYAVSSVVVRTRARLAVGRYSWKSGLVVNSAPVSDKLRLTQKILRGVPCRLCRSYPAEPVCSHSHLSPFYRCWHRAAAGVTRPPAHPALPSSSARMLRCPPSPRFPCSASVNAIDAKGNTVSLISGTPTVDFARYNGLQSLIDMNDVPAGTYTSVQITLGAANLSYLNTGSGAPTIVIGSRNPYHLHRQRHANHAPGRHPGGMRRRPAPGLQSAQIDPG